MIQVNAIYVLWMREMIKYARAKSRLVGAIAMPVFMLVFLGLGFRRVDIPGIPGSIGYIQYLVPGILGMTLLFSSAYTGMGVIMDRQYGFLKEVMVTPASRTSIVLGMIAGGATTSLVQATMMMFLSVLLGFRLPGLPAILAAVFIMLLICVIFINIGLTLSSVLKDFHGFNLIINFIVFPLFLLSGALFPVANLPAAIRVFSYLDPLTYGVDALRGIMIDFSEFSLLIDIGILIIISSAMVAISGYFFQKGEAL
ncbi:MAG: ABC-2 type transporter [Methanoregulaceae archaeon PtaB.Bin056]|jgi:ABC-2 type transport system permease protein|nr:MAG: ABC-2 type transporter [Methanoregulaceae archaeon PtaB.Bin056]